MNLHRNSGCLEKQLQQLIIRVEFLAILLTLIAALYFSLQENIRMMDTHLSNTAALLATQPEVHEIILRHHADEEFIQQMDSIVSRLSYLDIIGVFDLDCTRLYHIRHEWIGTPMSGGIEQAFFRDASPYLCTSHGDLGYQRRAFYPVFDDHGALIGYVVTGMLLTSTISSLSQIIIFFLFIALVLALAGYMLSRRFYRMLRSILLGYAPEQFSSMFLQTTAVLNALEEGVLGVNSQGRIISANQAAMQLLHLPSIPASGTAMTDVFEGGVLPHIPNVLVSSVTLPNAQGKVYILRDHQELTRLAERLTGAEHMVETLRAFNHEFKNKLHVILGYLQMNNIEAATEFITGASFSSTNAVSIVTRHIQTPALAALLIGKIVRADELGIRLTLDAESCCYSPLPIPEDVYITILGNLIENAIEEINTGNCSVREISVCLIIRPQGSIITVDDTGRGIPGDQIDVIFQKGYSTKGAGRGMGLNLVLQAIQEYDGRIAVDSDMDIGSSITVTLPGQPQ